MKGQKHTKIAKLTLLASKWENTEDFQFHLECMRQVPWFVFSFMALEVADF